MGCSSCKINNDSDRTDYFIDVLAFKGNFKKLIKKVWQQVISSFSPCGSGMLMQKNA